MIRAYCMLAKPGIVIGNTVTAAAGFALASKGHIDYSQFFIVLLGLSMIMGSGCAFNNYTDRERDKKMQRTKNRPLVKGSISLKRALAFATILALMGIIVLAQTNLLAIGVALIGFFVYVVLYPFWKYRSVYGTLVGSIAGAVPPVVGYCAVSGRFDLGALLLFIIVILWQMPHFFAIAMYRLEDYTAALIPVLPVKKGMHLTKIHMLLYVIAFAVAVLLPTFFGYTGYAYLTVAVLLATTWLWLCLKGFKSSDDRLWARAMFRFSLIAIMGLSAMLSFDTVR